MSTTHNRFILHFTSTNLSFTILQLSNYEEIQRKIAEVISLTPNMILKKHIVNIYRDGCVRI